MKLVFGERDYTFRSGGLFAFLLVLKDAYPGWVDMAGIESRMPGVDPRQLARFVDMLEEAGLPLVRYETKTRGGFKLAVDPESIAFFGNYDPPPPPPPGTTPLAPVLFKSIAALPLTAYQVDAWVVWVVALLHSTLELHSGHLYCKGGALGHLDVAEAACKSLPAWTASVVYVRRAFVLERQSNYQEAALWLRRVDTAIRQGYAHPAAKARANLVRSKIRYDQARYPEAERFLCSASEPGGMRDPYWLSMNALVAGRKFLSSADSEAPMLLSQTLSFLAEALGYVFLGHGDTSLLDGLCHNFGKNLLRGIKRGLIPEACADTVMQWLATNMLVCNKLGIGDDSVLSNLLLIDVGLEHGYSPTQWPQQLRKQLGFACDLGGLLEKALAQARQTGNRLEIAKCLQCKLRLITSPDEARRTYFEAVESYRDLGRKDMVLQLKEDWRIRFSSSPPARGFVA
ncbi:hypothetical protein [Propionivibrio sp.]|uniref:hypothetical protein n=1 Tax=Propionivibrio sp. TaxID=2212460 RepID=UPI003BF3CF91